MIFQYYPDTDMLYIKLANGVSTESEEVAPGIVLDFDERNKSSALRSRTPVHSLIYHNWKCRLYLLLL